MGTGEYDDGVSINVNDKIECNEIIVVEVNMANFFFRNPVRPDSNPI